MKQFYLILLFFSSFLVAAQPEIVPPAPMTQCDIWNNGFETFDLTQSEPEILNGLDPSQYSIEYFADAAHTVPILTPESFSSYPFVVFIRVTENANPSNFADTLLELVVNPIPVAYPVDDLVQVDSPFDGVATFDLSLNDAALTGGIAGISVTHYLTLADAQAGTAAIIPNSFVNFTNPQTIYVRLQDNVTGCFSISNFNVAVIPDDVIYIQDPVFKALLLGANETVTTAQGLTLNNIKIDVNDDGEIQYSEALQVYYLDVNAAGITSMKGIEYFYNLRRLYCGGNSLGALDLSTLEFLVELNVESSGVTSLNLTGVESLQTLFCSGNQLSSLDLTSNTGLRFLYCVSNGMTSLNISGLSQLEEVFCEMNQLSTIDLTGLSGLKYFSCRNNVLTSMDFSGVSNLLHLNIGANQLPALELNESPQLTVLVCGANQLTSLDLSSLPNLEQLNCPGNLLTTLDCSANSHLSYLSCYSNPLQTLFVKNGSDETFDPANWTEIPSLMYICADQSQLSELTAEVNSEAVAIQSYCTLEPGGPYNTITGTIRADIDSNGCDDSDARASFVKLAVTGSQTQGAVYSNASGVYTIFTGAGTTSVEVDFENNYYELVMPFGQDFAAADGSLFTQDICLVPNGTHPDLEVVVAPVIPARPGFTAVYKLTYRNKGNQVMSGSGDDIAFNYDAAHIAFLETDSPEYVITPGAISWTYANLQPFETRSITVSFTVNAPTNPDFPVNVGDVLDFSAQIAPMATDETPADNVFNYSQTVIGSYDPNNMYCIEGDVVDAAQIGKYLHYIVNFENTGTDMAENIVVTDEIDPNQFDINSLQIIESSDDVDVSISGNKVQLFFRDIKLPIGGHGNILLKIKSNNTLTQGDSVLNNANIFFDYNLPIQTNDATTLFEQLGVPGHLIDQTIAVYPNPTSGMVTVKGAAIIGSVELYDIQGRLLQKSFRSASEVSIDVSQHGPGVYFLKITSEKGIAIQRIVKK